MYQDYKSNTQMIELKPVIMSFAHEILIWEKQVFIILSMKTVSTLRSFPLLFHGRLLPEKG